MHRMLSTWRRATAVAVASLVTLTVACSTDTEREDDAPADGLLASVDTHYGTVDIPEPEDGDLTVVALGWSDGEAALSLGIKPVAIYDWQGFGEETKGVGPWASDMFGDDDPTLLARSAEDGYDYEKILSLEPDLILNVRAALDDDAYERLSQIAPTVQAPKDTPDFAVDWRTQTEVISEALGKADEGTEKVAELDDRFAAVRDEHPEFDGRTIAVGAKFGDSYGVSLPGDTRLDFYTELGFVPNDGIEDLPNTGGFFADVSNERLDVFDADVAVLFGIGLPVSEVEGDPKIRNLQVVRDGRALFSAPPEGVTAGTVPSLVAALDDTLPQLTITVDKLS